MAKPVKATLAISNRRSITPPNHIKAVDAENHDLVVSNRVKQLNSQFHKKRSGVFESG